MKCYYCLQMITVLCSTSDSFAKYTCNKCNVDYFFSPKINDIVIYLFRCKNFAAHFFNFGPNHNSKEPQPFFRLISFNPRFKIVLELDYHPNITPINFEKKLPILLTFL